MRRMGTMGPMGLMGPMAPMGPMGPMAPMGPWAHGTAKINQNMSESDKNLRSIF